MQQEESQKVEGIWNEDKNMYHFSVYHNDVAGNGSWCVYTCYVLARHYQNLDSLSRTRTSNLLLVEYSYSTMIIIYIRCYL